MTLQNSKKITPMKKTRFKIYSGVRIIRI